MDYILEVASQYSTPQFCSSVLTTFYISKLGIMGHKADKSKFPLVCYNPLKVLQPNPSGQQLS